VDKLAVGQAFVRVLQLAPVSIIPSLLHTNFITDAAQQSTVSFVTQLMLGVSKHHAVAQLVEALRYKQEGRGFDSRRRHWNFLMA
jgi:uncharacterized protein YoaH (UPF0181 family)